MFDKIKKIFKPEAPKTDLSVWDLRKGYIVDYFMQSWEVKTHGEYSFDGGSYATEYLIDNGSEKYFLYLEEDGTNDIISLSKTVAINSIDPLIRQSILDTDEAPKQFEYNGELYFFVESSAGLYKEWGEHEDDAAEFVVYDFKNKAEDKFVSVTRWSETEVEGAAGSYVKAFEFSNILPK